MRLTTKILIGTLIMLIMSNSCYIIQNIRKEIQFNRELTQKELKINDQIILDIYKRLKSQDRMNDIINERIDIVPQQIKRDKLQIVKKLQQVNIMIHNTTEQSLGSGVSIKYRGKFYVLSAGHMASVIRNNFNAQDSIELWENNGKVCDLEIVKHDYTTTEEDEIADFTKSHDLLLLKPTNPNFRPIFYTELADNEPTTATEIYIVGNPMGIEDVVSDGRIIKYKNNYMYYIDHTYFGNSGGGVYTQDGKLIGIVSHIYPLQGVPDFPPYLTYGAVRLNVIKAFLEDIK